jgi:RNA polymerase sigma factor (sigma-70 family)
MDAHPTPESLLRRAAGGDQAAREAVLAELYPRIRGIVHRQLEGDFRKNHRWMLPLFSTGDIVQEVFLGVVQDLDRFEPRGEGGLLAWVTAQVRHRILDLVRHHEALRRDRRREVVVADEHGDPVSFAGAVPTPSRCAELSEALAAWTRLLTELPARDRELLELRSTDDLGWREIAERLGFPSDEAARAAHRYLRAKLAVRLGRLGLHADPEREGAP